MINSWTFFWLVSGELSGTINLVLSCLGSLCRCTAYPYLLPPGEDFSICKTVQKYYYVYPFRRNQESAPSLHYCFLTIAPLSLHFINSLMSNCLNSRKKTRRGFCSQEPPGPAVVSFYILPDSLPHHGLQPARHPCLGPSPSPWAQTGCICSNSYP